MADDCGEFVRSRRKILGITQRELTERSGVKQPYIASIERGRRDAKVFGSVARGKDRIDADLDLLVEFTDQHDIVDLLDLEDELRRLLTVRTELVDARAHGVVIERAAAEAVPL